MKQYLENIYKGDFDSFVEIMHKNLINNIKQFIITANPETYTYVSKNKELEEIILNKKNSVVADGIGIVKACNILKIENIYKIPGVELAKKLLELGNENNKSIVLFGASEEVNKLLIKTLKKEYPNLKIADYSHGYIINKDIKFEELLGNEPDIIMVALGIPNQELLINKYYKNAKKGIFIGVGGSFDVISGYKKRAPQVFQNLNIEWFYRIIKEPKRIKRFYQNNIKFLLKIKKEK